MTEPYRHLYIHLPFCLSKCRHCDFYSFASNDEVEQARYVAAVLRELDVTKRPVEPETVYIGGGTPTHLSDENLQTLLTGLDGQLGLSGRAAAGGLEYSCEANPAGDLAGKFEILRRHGVNRVSLGLQTFDDEALRTIGRAHDAATGRHSYRLAREAGFPAVSLDIIFAHPGLSRAAELADLQGAIDLAPEHISAYAMTVSAETPFGLSVAAGELKPQAEDEAGDRLRLTAEFLEAAGYEQYEVSNFARPGCRCRHNEAYWQRRPYLGLGAGAHSYDGELRRSRNLPDAAAYAETLLAGKAPPRESEELSREAVLIETVYLALRMADGLDLGPGGRLRPDEQARIRARSRRLIEEGLAREQDEKIVLTPDGLALADACAIELLTDH